MSYADLSERGRRFVDEARDGHRVRRLETHQGRVYVSRDSATGQWVRNEDPITTDGLDGGLECIAALVDGYVEIDDEQYTFANSSAMGRYAWEFAADSAEGCDDVVAASTLPDGAQKIAETVVEQGPAWVAGANYEPVFDAAVYYESVDARKPFFDLVDRWGDGGCLESGGERYRISVASDLAMSEASYQLNRRDE